MCIMSKMLRLWHKDYFKFYGIINFILVINVFKDGGLVDSVSYMLYGKGRNMEKKESKHREMIFRCACACHFMAIDYYWDYDNSGKCGVGLGYIIMKIDTPNLWS